MLYAQAETFGFGRGPDIETVASARVNAANGVFAGQWTKVHLTRETDKNDLVDKPYSLRKKLARLRKSRKWYKGTRGVRVTKGGGAKYFADELPPVDRQLMHIHRAVPFFNSGQWQGGPHILNQINAGNGGLY